MSTITTTEYITTQDKSAAMTPLPTITSITTETIIRSYIESKFNNQYIYTVNILFIRLFLLHYHNNVTINRCRIH